MKKTVIKISCVLSLLVGFTACKDKLAELYTDPNKVEEAAVDKLFTAMLNNKRVRPEYWDIRTFALQHTAKYTQTASFLNGNRMYQQQLAYLQNRWDDYYTASANGSGVVAQYREMEKIYASLSESQKADADVFMQAAKVVYLDQTSQMVDLWGDIPFTEAGSLNLTAQVNRPKFDDAKSVYDAVLSGLKDASAYFAGAQLSPVARRSFQTQDILLGGDLKQWQRYSNSLRLRLLMRISLVDEGRARTEVGEMLSNPDQFPLVDKTEFNVLLKALSSNTATLTDAFAEVSGQFAPAAMLEGVMKPANDPRIPVMFDKFGRTVSGKWVPNADYVGLPTNASAAEQENNVNLGRYATLDSATFIQNNQLPGIVITASEVNLLKAEAFERWGGGDAVAAYKTALEQSVAFYYYLNGLSKVKAPVPPPTAEELEAFLTNPTVAYAGAPEEKLAKIWTQKWVHLGVLQSTQAWAEVRRTDYPKLTFQPDNTTPDAPVPPSRLLYPATEKSQNAANYASVAGEDTPTTKIFWDVK